MSDNCSNSSASNTCNSTSSFDCSNSGASNICNSTSNFDCSNSGASNSYNSTSNFLGVASATANAAIHSSRKRKTNVYNLPFYTSVSEVIIVSLLQLSVLAYILVVVFSPPAESHPELNYQAPATSEISN